MAFNQFFFDQVVSQLPKKWMSHQLGAAAHLRVPARLNKKLIRLFAKHYNIELEEIEKPLEEYSSLGEFFSRRLKPDARPIQGEVVHPCDSVLIESGLINGDVLIQAKGKSFELGDFLPGSPWVSDFQDGSFFTYYLAPHNYHRVHSPVTGDVEWSTVVPGQLWPVNSWSVKNVDGLYAINERVATGIQTARGKVIVVMVGATNVGSISMAYDPNIKTNTPGKKEVVHRAYPEPRRLQAGDELGTFHLGSTAVVLFEPGFGFKHRERQDVLMGQKF